MKASIVTALCLIAGSAQAEMNVQNGRYLCDRNVEVPVVYATDTDPDGQAIAVLMVEGGQILLYAGPAASGVRYGWPSDGSSYVWWTKDNEATLLWRNGETGEESVLLAACAMQ